MRVCTAIIARKHPVTERKSSSVSIFSPRPLVEISPYPRYCSANRVWILSYPLERLRSPPISFCFWCSLRVLAFFSFHGFLFLSLSLSPAPDSRGVFFITPPSCRPLWTLVILLSGVVLPNRPNNQQTPTPIAASLVQTSTPDRGCLSEPGQSETIARLMAGAVRREGTWVARTDEHECQDDGGNYCSERY